jgi:hypothetical protein
VDVVVSRVACVLAVPQSSCWCLCVRRRRATEVSTVPGCGVEETSSLMVSGAGVCHGALSHGSGDVKTYLLLSTCNACVTTSYNQSPRSLRNRFSSPLLRRTCLHTAGVTPRSLLCSQVSEARAPLRHGACLRRMVSVASRLHLRGCCGVVE